MLEIVGQDKLINMFDYLIETNTLPRFLMLTGQRGAGKKTLVEYIANKLGATLYKPEAKVNVDYVRDIINQAYKQTELTIYLLPDIDYINQSSANALLKITEEPPNNAFFILTCIDGRTVPSTIKSRCVTYRLNTYSRDTLWAFAKTLNANIEDKKDQIFKLCCTPGDIITFLNGVDDYKSLEEFTTKVINNIGLVSEANVFKIADNLAFKETDTGYNLNTFWIMFNNICMQRTKDIHNSKRSMYFTYMRITSEYRNKLSFTGLNKRSLFDLWIIEIRESFNKYN